MLDHILLGASDLDLGITHVEKLSGVRAAVGGSHPGAGTQNALLGLGAEQYLEIIAPDPKQSFAPKSLAGGLANLSSPRLIAWAWRTENIAGLAEGIAKVGMAVDGLREGSRRRPNGEMLRWKSLRLKDDRDGIFPFFIEWGPGTKHPAADAPAGCRLTSFSVTTENPDELQETFRLIGIEVKIEMGTAQKLRAILDGAHWKFELSS
jgi:hypothetical protein